jgi:redox-sensitive bicupin YhaK (pirin superfamily)
MIALRKADERGATRLDWLDSCHSFSFADYRDPAHVHFGPLRVINEDVIALGCGFSTHGHRDMEIVNYILSGALAHRDSLGTGSEIRPGEIQRMSAGTGIRHSEYNASQEDAAHLLQIWILPAHSGLEPSYEQKRFDEKEHFSGVGRSGSHDLSCTPQ